MATAPICPAGCRSYDFIHLCLVGSGLCFQLREPASKDLIALGVSYWESAISFGIFHHAVPILLHDWIEREQFVYVGWSGLLLSYQ